MNETNIARYYRPELDVLRFFAFLSVFTVHRMDHVPIHPAQHYWLYNVCLLGNFGVPVFFLLSAFLITELLLREDDRLGTIHVRSFYMRRILRIWPLYFGVFYGLILLNHVISRVGAPDPLSWLAFTLFAGNWYICLHGWIPANPVDPLWSISVEEQFYIAIPVIATFGRRLGLKIVSSILLAVSYAMVPVVYLGRISYGLYLFHQFFYTLIFDRRKAQLDRLSTALYLTGWSGAVGTVLTFCIAVLMAHLSYRFYEKPFLELKRRFTFVPSRD